MGSIFMNSKNSKTSKSHVLIPRLTEKIRLSFSDIYEHL